MAIPEYSKAHKMATKVYKHNLAKGDYPYLPILDDLLSFTETAGERDLGLIEIPLDRVIGTKTSGRTRSFAANFMPLLAENTEFADKWCSLYRSHMEEGIRDPIIVCEFMNYYYVIEGNKRVSVLKFSDAVSVDAYVTRILPMRTDSENSRLYYEYVDFHNNSGINTIYFSHEGGFRRLCRLIGKSFEEPWSDDERSTFRSCLLRFTDAYHKKGGEKLPITVGDAFLAYLDIYDYQELSNKSVSEVAAEISKLKEVLTHLPKENTVGLVMQPKEKESASMIRRLLPQTSKLKIGFIFFRTKETSGWTNSHNLGRLYLEEQLEDSVATLVYDGVETEEESMVLIEQAIEDGCQVIFTTSPRFLSSSIKASVKYPNVKILNCSLNTNQGQLRTYYGRLYEAKFLVGMVAGILTDTANVGYVADFPIAGTPASINAFALGVKMVNPKAHVHLAWSSMKENHVDEIMRAANVSHISGRDTMAPLYSDHPYGLYDMKTGGTRLAASIWHWGKFYLRIVQTILNGKWTRDTIKAPAGNSINYWWGMSSGMIDFIYSNSVPKRTMQLVKLMKTQIIAGNFHVFSGEIYDQGQVLRADSGLSPAEIIQMDWLVDNIIGEIPDSSRLKEEAAAMAEIQGIRTRKETRLV